jgi:hypothetical protein
LSETRSARNRRPLDGVWLCGCHGAAAAASCRDGAAERTDTQWNRRHEMGRARRGRSTSGLLLSASSAHSVPFAGAVEATEACSAQPRHAAPTHTHPGRAGRMRCISPLPLSVRYAMHVSLCCVLCVRTTSCLVAAGQSGTERRLEPTNLTSSRVVDNVLEAASGWLHTDRHTLRSTPRSGRQIGKLGPEKGRQNHEGASREDAPNSVRRWCRRDYAAQ